MEHPIKQELIDYVKYVMEALHQIKDAKKELPKPESRYLEGIRVEEIVMDTGCIRIQIQVGDRFYYDVLSELTGADIAGEYDLIRTLKQLSVLRKEYEGVKDAMDSVRLKGYGVVTPAKEEIKLEEPILMKQGINTE